MSFKFKWETEFKETEIGKIPKDWKVKGLEKILDSIIKGKPPLRKLKGKGHLPYLSAKYLRGEEEALDFYPEEAGYVVGEEDILILWDGANAGEIFRGKKGLLPSTVCKLIFKKDVNKDFIYLVLKNQEKELKDAKKGTDDRHVDKEYFLTFPIPYPSPTEQSRIATVLSWFDDLIENKKRQNEILEKVAMAIFKSWFVDFEPFKNEEFVYNEELGKEIPEGWEVDFATKFIDFNPPIRLIKGKVYPFVEMKQVSTNSAVCDFDYKEFTGSGVRYRGGDTLMARITPSLEHGKTAYVWFISEEEYGFGTTEFFVLHPKEPYLKEFTYLLAKSEDFRDVAINSMTGTSGRQRADVNALKNFLIPIPPQPILEKFHSLVEPLFQKIILNQKQIMILRKIRDALLPKLVFGKLRVEEI